MYSSEFTRIASKNSFFFYAFQLALFDKEQLCQSLFRACRFHLRLPGEHLYPLELELVVLIA